MNAAKPARQKEQAKRRATTTVGTRSSKERASRNALRGATMQVGSTAALVTTSVLVAVSDQPNLIATLLDASTLSTTVGVTRPAEQATLRTECR